MDWKEYEDITKHIYETLGKDSGVRIICHGKDCKVTGKSKVDHQIDVLTQHSDGLHNYKTAIECKYWDKSINKDIVMKVAEIVEDAGLNKGIIVSKNGFTPDATNYAEYRNIGLVELRELRDEDWKGRIRNISINLNLVLPELLSIEFLTNPSIKNDFQTGRTRLEFLKIKKENGELEPIENYFEEFGKELSQKNEDETYEKKIQFGKPTEIINELSNQIALVDGFKLSGILRIAQHNFEIKGEDHIWLIMKSIFENKTFTIDKDKSIKEREK